MDVQEVSAQLFGRPCRLPLALWIAGHGGDRFYQSEPPDELGSATALRQELQRLETLGMLTVERGDDRRLYYQRTESPLWDIVRAARDAVGAPYEPER